MGQYVDSSLLNMANPANSKNELQAIGDGFKEMYNNYVRTRLSQNEIDLSDLRLGYERATQDDRIRAIKLGTENLANQVRKSAVDANIAEETQQDKIIQEKTKTANDLEILKQSQITSYFMPKKYQADINHSNASASNLLANASFTNLRRKITQHEFNENETMKNLYSRVSAYAQTTRKQGEEAYDGYYNSLYLNYLDAKDKGFDVSGYEKELNLLNKFKPEAMQRWKLQFDGANPYPKNNGNGANGGNDYSNVLTQIGQANAIKEQLEKELDTKTRAIDKMKAKELDTQELEQEKAVIEQKLSQLQSVPNTANAKSLMNYFTDSLGKTTGEKTYNQMIQYSQIKQDIAMVADAIDTVALYGWSGEALNRLGHMFGVATNKDDINNKIIALLNNIQGDTGTRLKQQYENIVKLTPNTSAFGMNVKRMQQELTNLNEHINININSTLYPHKENAEIIKKSFNISTKPLEFKYNYENYKKMALSEMEKDILKQYPNAKGINPNGTLRYY